MARKKTNDEFLIEANIIHNNKFTYPEEYIKSNIKINITCSVHGNFPQLPNDHLRGFGCKKCADDLQRSKKDDVFKKANIVHNNSYDYSKSIYLNSNTLMEIICPKHGIFKQSSHTHIDGKSKCPDCVIEDRRKDNNIYLNEVNKKHNNFYTYKNMNYINNYTKIMITCPIHGNFPQIPKAHLQGQGCPTCNESKGEKIISKYLIENNIDYIKEKRFKECKHIKTLPFDFYIEAKNICIEYDGIQHFEPIEIMGGQKRYNEQKIKDQIKNEYCSKNNIRLIRIRYDENIIDKLIFYFNAIDVPILST